MDPYQTQAQKTEGIDVQELAQKFNYGDFHEDNSFFGKFKYHLIDFIQTLVVFGAIFAIIYLFVARPHKVDGKSMFPTFEHGDFIITDKLSYRFSEPKKGDVIVLENPRNKDENFIKRIIATPGDSLKIQNNSVYLNGNKLDEKFLPDERPTPYGSYLLEGQEVVASDNDYYVFGDNREHSSDSREWGPITREEIVGKVFFRYWPPTSFGIFKTP